MNSNSKMTGKKQVVFIINPVSGVKQYRKAGIEQVIDELLDLDKFNYKCLYTDSAEHAVEISRNAASSGADIIASVGGDGTANRVIKGMIGSSAVLALIPAGSGNGLARFLNIPLDFHKSIDLINQHDIKVIDTVNINDDVFASIAGVGFDALVARKFAKAGRRGFFSYFHIALQAYPGYRPRKYKMIIDGNEIKRKALFVSFANGNQFGYNTIIAPDAEIDDGLIDVCVVQKAPVIETPYIMGLLWRNKLVNSGYLEIIKAKEVTLFRNRNKSINLDGEPVKLGKDLVIKVNPASLKIIVP
ncbi:MAG: diacylglycerol/lipid kinase family protein [Omnitrophica WOR_2 bacterium]